jgi:hypothetical protein
VRVVCAELCHRQLELEIKINIKHLSILSTVVVVVQINYFVSTLLLVTPTVQNIFFFPRTVNKRLLCRKQRFLKKKKIRSTFFNENYL